MPTALGTYQWVAVYSGDASNNPAAGVIGDEPEKVTGSGTIGGTKYLDLPETTSTTSSSTRALQPAFTTR